MWSLATPVALLLLPLPWLLRPLLAPRVEAGGAVYLPAGIAAAMQPPQTGRVAAQARRLLPALIWGALVLALAGPRALQTTEAMPASGRDIVLALDLSGSMEIQDFHLDGEALTRLQAVKKVGARFVRGRSGDRVALVIFGNQAYFAAPLSFDTEAVARSIETASIGISGRSTALSEGLGLALKRLVDSDAASRVVIFLSDGVDTSGSVEAAAVGALARSHGVRVHTIALGPDDLETTPNARDAVDSATLREVAARSGGETFRVRTMADLAAVAAALDRLEPSLAQRPPLQVQREYWVLPAAAALWLAVLLLLIRGREQ